MTEFDAEFHGPTGPTPEKLPLPARIELACALESLPPRSREVLVLRELEGCSYEEIAVTTSIPIGTVMCSLSRGRRQLLWRS